MRTTTYQERAQATRSRRRKAGAYATPAQKAAFAKLLQRDGEANLTQAEVAALASHPNLTASQRQHYAAMSVNWS